MCSVNNDAVPAEVDETHSHMKPVVVLEMLDLARYIIASGHFWWTYFRNFILNETCMTMLQCQTCDSFYKKPRKLSEMQVNICIPNVAKIYDGNKRI